MQYKWFIPDVVVGRGQGEFGGEAKKPYSKTDTAATVEKKHYAGAYRAARAAH